MSVSTMPSRAETVRLQHRKRVILTVILISVGIHVIVGIVAGIVIVARYLTEPPAEFKVTKDIRIPAEEREHKMNMAAFDGMAPKPSFTDKMQSLRPAALALPELPRIPMDQMLPLDPAEILADQVAALTGPGGAGSGIGLGAGGGGGSAGIETGFSFMGIESKGKRILLIFDVSASVLNKARKSGISLAKIKEETIGLLQQLPINARFGLIQFTQNFKAFREELLAATEANRAAAKTWIEEEWVDTGSMQASSKVTRNPRGVVGVFEMAAQMVAGRHLPHFRREFPMEGRRQPWRRPLGGDRESRQGTSSGHGGLRTEFHWLSNEAGGPQENGIPRPRDAGKKSRDQVGAVLPECLIHFREESRKCRALKERSARHALAEVMIVPLRMRLVACSVARLVSSISSEEARAVVVGLWRATGTSTHRPHEQQSPTNSPSYLSSGRQQSGSTLLSPTSHCQRFLWYEGNTHRASRDGC